MSLAELIVLGLVILLAALLAIGLRGRSGGASATISVVAFAALALLAFSAFVPSAPYRTAADAALRAAGVKERVREIDEAFIFNDLAASGRDLAGELSGLLSGNQRARDFFRGILGDDILPDEPLPTEPDTEAVTAPEPEPGIFERRLYPSFVDVFAGFLRVAMLATSMAGMVAVAALGAASGAARRLAVTNRRLSEVEARLARLEPGGGRQMAEDRVTPGG